MEYVVYFIVNKVTGKVYIGRSQEYEKRFRAHKNMLRKNKHNNLYLQKDWNDLGEYQFEFKIIETFDKLEHSILSEEKYINDDSIAKYNIGGAYVGGDRYTNNPRLPETKRIKSLQTSGKNNPMYGKKKSELNIKRIKEANSKAISINDEKYISLTEASIALTLPISTVSYRLRSSSEKFKDWIYV